MSRHKSKRSSKLIQTVDKWAYYPDSEPFVLLDLPENPPTIPFNTITKDDIARLYEYKEKHEFYSEDEPEFPPEHSFAEDEDVCSLFELVASSSSSQSSLTSISEQEAAVQAQLGELDLDEHSAEPTTEPKTPQRPPSHKSSSSSRFHPETPPKNNRSHTTAARNLSAALLKAGPASKPYQYLRCLITNIRYDLEVAHMFANHFQSTDIHKRAQFAIGGPFCVNSRLNYSLLHCASHKIVDRRKPVVTLILTDPPVLENISRYLNWLDVHLPINVQVSDQPRCDYYRRLRGPGSPFEDGQLYHVQLVAISPIALNTIFREDPTSAHPPPFLTLASIVHEAYANPLFILLNTIQQLEPAFPDFYQRCFGDNILSANQWESWIKSQDRLAHLCLDTDDSRTTRNRLASFLVVVAHLRRRLGMEEIVWTAPEKIDPADGSFLTPSMTTGTNKSRSTRSRSTGTSKSHSTRSRSTGTTRSSTHSFTRSSTSSRSHQPPDSSERGRSHQPKKTPSRHSTQGSRSTVRSSHQDHPPSSDRCADDKRSAAEVMSDWKLRNLSPSSLAASDSPSQVGEIAPSPSDTPLHPSTPPSSTVHLLPRWSFLANFLTMPFVSTERGLKRKSQAAEEEQSLLAKERHSTRDKPVSFIRWTAGRVVRPVLDILSI